MKNHMQAQLFKGMVAKCPHEGCKSEMKLDSYGKFLPSKLILLMKERLKEASMPVKEKYIALILDVLL